VHKGDPLFTIYGPDLAATQEVYLFARRNMEALCGSSIDGEARQSLYVFIAVILSMSLLQ